MDLLASVKIINLIQDVHIQLINTRNITIFTSESQAHMSSMGHTVAWGGAKWVTFWTVF